jgi:replicative DNA helicase
MLYLQIAALKLGLSNEQLFSKLQHQLFTDKVASEVYKTAKMYLITNNKLPSLSVLKSILETESDIKLDELNAFFEALEKETVSEDEFNTILAKLNDYYEGIQLRKTLEKMIELLTDNKIKKAKELFLISASDIHLYTPELTSTSLGKDLNLERVDEQLRDTKFCIPTGFRDLDEKINGFSKHEFVVLAAVKGTGKSTLMQNLAINNYLMGYSPVYVNLELSEREWIQRLLSSLSGIPASKLRNGTLTLEDKITIQKSLISFVFSQKYVQEVLEWYDKNTKTICELSFKDFSETLKKTFPKKYFRQNTLEIPTWQNKLSVNELIDKVNSLKKEKKCDILYIDYIDFLYIPFQESLPYWEKLKNVAETLKMAAKHLEIPIVTAAQLDERMQDTRYSRAITEACDIAFSWKPELTPEEEDTIPDIRIFKFYTIKSRNIAPIKHMVMEADFLHHKVIIKNG